MIEIGTHKRVSEYDGAFKCLDCHAMWGALSGKPVMPVQCNDAFRRIQVMVNKQAEDEGLWFDAKTAPEAYLQKALRDLHRVIEDEAF